MPMIYCTLQFSHHYHSILSFLINWLLNFTSLQLPFRILTCILVIPQYSSNLKSLRTFPFIMASENYSISFIYFDPYSELPFINPLQIILDSFFYSKFLFKYFNIIITLTILSHLNFTVLFSHSFIFLFPFLLKNSPISIPLTWYSFLPHLQHLIFYQISLISLILPNINFIVSTCLISTLVWLLHVLFGS